MTAARLILAAALLAGCATPMSAPARLHPTLATLWFTKMRAGDRYMNDCNTCTVMSSDGFGRVLAECTLLVCTGPIRGIRPLPEASR